MVLRVIVKHNKETIVKFEQQSNDISLELMQLPVDTFYENILLQIGSNGYLENDFDTDYCQENYMVLVKVAKYACDNVVISGLVPRLDDRICNIDKGNIVLDKIANNDNCLFVNNDDSFRLCVVQLIQLCIIKMVFI